MFNSFKKYFISGLVVFLPIALTIYLFYLAIGAADNLLGKYLAPYFYENFGFYFRGISIIVGVYIIVLIGFLATNFFGKRIYEFFDGLFAKIPLVKQVYPAIKEIATFLFTRDQMKSFKQVVIVEYPRKGVYSMGFLTATGSPKICELTKKELCNVFLPSAPGPLTGFVVMFPKKEVVFTDVKIEDAFKFILSGGVVNPPV